MTTIPPALHLAPRETLPDDIKLAKAFWAALAWMEYADDLWRRGEFIGPARQGYRFAMEARRLALTAGLVPMAHAAREVAVDAWEMVKDKGRYDER